ncbi:MAG TPA: DUF3656 domain-containing protein [Methanosarcina sp.]|nr:DUF3656 domain-containing protein [Methanosarcina sp.]
MKPEIPELLAPAGGMEALIAAVENGADAVYLGSRAFSARGYASNFSEEELEEAVDYAHLRGVKIYVTVNTLLKEDEMESALILLSHLREIGVDAVIVQDLGLISLAREYFPDLPLHASTQMTLHNSEGVKFVKNLGIKRAVLSRETSLQDIKRIKERSEAKIEVFIHGALCISYSGQCLLSSLIGGRSGNRGYCAQPCRKKYRLYCEGKQIKTEGNYLLSPKDLNTSSGIGALMEAGIDSFKIEGRMKRPEYVAGVVRIYRRLIDRYTRNPDGYFISEEEREILTQLFNRGFIQGYFFENPRGELMSRENPHNRGIPAGTVTGYNRLSNRIYVKLSRPLRLGDGIMVENAKTMSEDKGKILSSMYTEKGAIYNAGTGEIVEIPFDSKAPLSSTVYRTHDKKLMDSLKKESESGNLSPKIPVFIRATIEKGKPIWLEIKDKDSTTATIESEYLVEKAEKQPTSKAQVEKQLSKLGNTLFEAVELKVCMEGDVFIPMGQLNYLRTKAILQLENLRISRWKRKPLQKIKISRELQEKKAHWKREATSLDPYIRPMLTVSVYSLDGLKGALVGGADCIYFGEGLFRKPLTEGQKEVSEQDLDVVFEKAVMETRAAGKKIYFSTPKIVKDSEMKAVENIFSRVRKLRADGILALNLGVLSLAKAEKIPFVADSSLNIFNSYTFSLFFQGGAQRTVLSPELTLDEIKCIACYGPAECIVQGLLELMISEHCLVGGLLGKDKKKCSVQCRSGNFTLVDEKNYEFPLFMDYQCRMHLLNSRNLCMLEYMPALLESGISSFRIETLGIEDPKEIEKIVRAYRNTIDTWLETGKLGEEKCKGEGFTTGHYFRGVQ